MFKGIKKKFNKKGNQKSTFLDIGSVILRTLKLMADFFYIIILLLGVLGTGIAFGYLGS